MGRPRIAVAHHERTIMLVRWQHFFHSLVRCGNCFFALQDTGARKKADNGTLSILNTRVEHKNVRNKALVEILILKYEVPLQNSR